MIQIQTDVVKLKTLAIQKENKMKIQDIEEAAYVLPSIDRERYDDMPGMEGPMMTKSGKVVYYDPKMGAYYDRDSDMYLSYDEFQALDKGNMYKVDEALKYNFMVLDQDGRVMGMTTGEKDAMRMAKGDNIRGQTGRYVKLRRPMSQTRGDRLIGQLPAHNLEEAEGNEIAILRGIVDNKQAEKLHGVMVDMFTASALVQVYDKVNDENQEKMKNMLKTPQGLRRMADFALSKIS